ncbi:hypothetical protein L1987_81282 [Smallanthus sonchifolius]|uniref:Uncharacterized protein n=1 Tax=Smallanthus sonchifolius TaxID=185202 RepID=A0ACB8YQM9_9ASTR|nr:hypothetical protein L1987_81282 [Smallanthus sonchifolius]
MDASASSGSILDSRGSGFSSMGRDFAWLGIFCFFSYPQRGNIDDNDRLVEVMFDAIRKMAAWGVSDSRLRRELSFSRKSSLVDGTCGFGVDGSGRRRCRGLSPHSGPDLLYLW